MLILSILVTLIVIFVLLIVLGYNAAKNKQQATFLEAGTIEFVKAGEDLYRTLVRVAGYYFHEGPTTLSIRIGVETTGKDIKDTEGNIIEKDATGKIVETKFLEIPEWPEGEDQLRKINSAIVKIPVIDAIVPMLTDEEEADFEERKKEKEEKKKELDDEKSKLDEEKKKLDEEKKTATSDRKKEIDEKKTATSDRKKVIDEEKRTIDEEKKIVDEERKNLIEERRKKHYKWWQRRWGFYWVSWFYPLRRLHRFEIPRTHLLEHPKKKAGATEVTAEDWIEELKPYENRSFLLWQFPRPIIVKAAEFRDLFTADLVLGSILQVVIPYRPMFVYKGNFFPQVMGAIRGAVIDFCRKVTFQQFIRYFKTGYGAEDFYLRVISPINEHREKAPRGTIEEFGIWVRNVWVQEIVPTTDVGRTMLNALRAQEIAELQGKATRTTADYARQALELEGQGRAAALKAQLDAAGKDVLLAQLEVNRVAAAGGQLGTYVEGGAKANIMVQAEGKQPPKTEGGSTS